jgi:DNA-directed RNA polymerase II subunit RPB9
MLKPTDEGNENSLIFECRMCKNKRKKVEIKEEDDYRIKSQKLTAGTDTDIFDKEMILDPSMPREEIKCPRCDYNEAVFYLKTAKDENRLIFVYICARLDENGTQPGCGFYWDKDKYEVELMN